MSVAVTNRPRRAPRGAVVCVAGLCGGAGGGGLGGGVGVGAVVCVAGLCGGAGATTLALLLALAAVRWEGGPVLVADASPGGALSVYAGVRSSLSLVAASGRVAAGAAVERGALFAVGRAGV